jgi:hypothetical protein
MNKEKKMDQLGSQSTLRFIVAFRAPRRAALDVGRAALAVVGGHLERGVHTRRPPEQGRRSSAWHLSEERIV